jgi:hypothetical protein
LLLALLKLLSLAVEETEDHFAKLEIFGREYLVPSQAVVPGISVTAEVTLRPSETVAPVVAVTPPPDAGSTSHRMVGINHDTSIIERIKPRFLE